jgi:hypothetical protein
MAQKSGRYWVAWANAHAMNSKDTNALDPGFRVKVEAFIRALKTAGATVTISATRRNAKRAYLFHWAWLISQGKCAPSDPSAMQGVDIEWDHGDLKRSKAGAREMVDGFGLAVPPASVNPPSLVSDHISGKAIDMTITWQGTLKIRKKDGTVVDVPYQPNPNTNIKLQEVGASYGVRKLKTDRPHWSYDGR